LQLENRTSHLEIGRLANARTQPARSLRGQPLLPGSVDCGGGCSGGVGGGFRARTPCRPKPAPHPTQV